jgi:hypothetical protein
MKTQNLIIAIFLVVFLSVGINFNASAQTSYKENKGKNFFISLFEKNNKVESVENQIQKMLDYPEIETVSTEYVKVRLIYQVTPENKIKVITAISENKAYSEYIRKTLEGKSVVLISDNPGEYKAMDVVFKYVD